MAGDFIFLSHTHTKRTPEETIESIHYFNHHYLFCVCLCDWKRRKNDARPGPLLSPYNHEEHWLDIRCDDDGDHPLRPFVCTDIPSDEGPSKTFVNEQTAV